MFFSWFSLGQKNDAPPQASEDWIFVKKKDIDQDIYSPCGLKKKYNNKTKSRNNSKKKYNYNNKKYKNKKQRRKNNFKLDIILQPLTKKNRRRNN